MYRQGDVRIYCEQLARFDLTKFGLPYLVRCWIPKTPSIFDLHEKLAVDLANLLKGDDMDEAARAVLRTYDINAIEILSTNDNMQGIVYYDYEKHPDNGTRS